MKEKMRAAVFEGEGKLVVKEVDIPKVRYDNEVRIKISQCGICGSDIRGLTVPPQYVYTKNIAFGHEFVGRVDQVGEAVDWLVKGDRVVIDPNIGCGHCYFCRTGNVLLCPNMVTVGQQLNGGMAEYCVVPQTQLFKMPDNMSDEDGIFVEPMACVLNGVIRAALRPGEDVVIFGAGPMGLLHMLILRAAGAKNIIISEISENRRKFAKALGADICVDPESESLTKIVGRATEDLGVDLAVDTVGILLPQAIDVVRKGGKIISFGINEQKKITFNQAKTVLKEINLIGAFAAKRTFPLAMKLLYKKDFSLSKLLTHKFPLEEVTKGIDLMKSGEGIKVSIVI
ncbi:D-arabitol-phosphate dehydrogenase [subsurface metagenome]